MKQKIPNRVILPLKKYHLDKIKVLDVGCGFGEYLQFFGEGSMGIDIKADRVQKASGMGFHIVEGNIEDIDNVDLPRNYFDAAWLSNILEHVNSPHETLTNVLSLLKENGIAFIKIPLIPNTIFGKVYKVLSGKKKLGFLASSHKYAFTRKTAEFDILRSGFEIVESSAFFPPNRFYKIFDFFFKDMIPTITIVARKK